MELLFVNFRLVIVHRMPKYIEVAGVDFWSQVLGLCEMEVDLFDGLTRSLKQLDDCSYAMFGQLRWRLFFKSDFMV